MTLASSKPLLDIERFNIPRAAVADVKVLTENHSNRLISLVQIQTPSPEPVVFPFIFPFPPSQVSHVVSYEMFTPTTRHKIQNISISFSKIEMKLINLGPNLWSGLRLNSACARLQCSSQRTIIGRLIYPDPGTSFTYPSVMGWDQRARAFAKFTITADGPRKPFRYTKHLLFLSFPFLQ